MLTCLDAESVALLLSSMDQSRIQSILAYAPPEKASAVLAQLALMGDKSGAPIVSLSHRWGAPSPCSQLFVRGAVFAEPRACDR